VGPGDIALGETLEFLQAALPPPPRRILEVGCGTGRLAAALSGLGYDLTGIDTDGEAVAEARRSGVAAIQADVLKFESEPFDAVLFTRSLHHIHPVDEAVARALRLLRADGLLVCDEFDKDGADSSAAAWFYDVQAVLRAAGVLEREGDDVLVDQPLERWLEEHESDEGHPLAGGEAMLRALEARFEVILRERCPYLYRYIGQRLEQTERGERIARRLLEVERLRLADGAMGATGLRILARPRGPG
jgi:SAM-dependent methyltransferase